MPWLAIPYGDQHDSRSVINQLFKVAGIPTLVLWNFPDQPVSGAALKRLKVGTSRRFSATTERTLTADLRQILAPEYTTRARELAAQTSGASASASDTAALVENFARSQRVG